MKLFIADDSSLIRDRLAGAAGEIPGIQIIGQAGDTETAVQGIRSSSPDVVILDLRMPGGGGMKVLRSIKEERTSPKVIVFTNYPYPQYRAKCMQLSADYFLDKSMEYDKLIDLLKRFSREECEA